MFIKRPSILKALVIYEKLSSKYLVTHNLGQKRVPMNKTQEAGMVAKGCWVCWGIVSWGTGGQLTGRLLAKIPWVMTTFLSMHELGVVVLNSSPLGRGRKIRLFRVILGYVVNTNPAWTTGDSLKNKNKTKQNRKEKVFQQG